MVVNPPNVSVKWVIIGENVTLSSLLRSLNVLM